MISEPEADPVRDVVVVDPDARRGAGLAIARSGDSRTAVWVGEETDPALAEFLAEIGRR